MLLVCRTLLRCVLWLWVMRCILWLLHALAHDGMLLLLMKIGCVRLLHVLLLMMLWQPRRGAWLMHLLIPWHTISCLHHAAMFITLGITWLLGIGVSCRKEGRQQQPKQ